MSYAYSSIYGIPLIPIVKRPLSQEKLKELDEFYNKHMKTIKNDNNNNNNYIYDIKKINYSVLNANAPEFIPKKRK
jgi:hypothetical protein